MRKQYGWKPLGACAAAAFLFLGAAAWAQAPARPPVEAFFQKASVGSALLSPDGKHVAMSIEGKTGRKQLFVLDTETLAGRPLAAYSNGDVGSFAWVNNDRLVYSIFDAVASGQMAFRPQLFAVDRDGANLSQLTDRQQASVARGMRERHVMDSNTRLLGTTRLKNSDDIFVVQPVFDELDKWVASNILRVDTRTGRATPFQRPGLSRDWILDPGDVPRISKTLEDNRMAVHYLDPGTGKWRKLAEFDPFDGSGFDPIGFAPDGTLYVKARNGGDKQALYRYDLEKNALVAEPLVSLPDYDFVGTLVTDRHRLIGVKYLSDAPGTLWLDPEHQQLQAKIDRLLPGAINYLEFAEEGPHVLVLTFSDVEPGTLLLFNKQTEKFSMLGQGAPAIDRKQMARVDFVKYKARDGLVIPAWLTLPKGTSGKNLPLVVVVHSGPWNRGDTWRWDPAGQFLASRGYAVLLPEYRGGAGFGFKHFRAGWKQWGLAMQDDLADGARWAIAQGIADPARICIMGSDYGGYATLMGLIKDPDLFRCGIDWSGVTDIDLLYTALWSDLDQQSKLYGIPRLVADRKLDAAQIEATSPLSNAHRLTQPLLLAHGGAARRVPVVHAVRFRDAVKKTNPHVEWVEYLNEGQNIADMTNKVDFWTRVEKFLERNIGAK